MQMYFPLALAVLANVVYHICSKSVPSGANPWLALAMNYAIALALTAGLYFCTKGTASITEDVGKLNWAPAILGLSVVGMEIGNLLMYRMGWEMSLGPLVQHVLVSSALLVVGALLFKEGVSPAKIAGVAVCCVGLWLVAR